MFQKVVGLKDEMWFHKEFYQFVDARFAIQWHTITKAIKVRRRIIRYDNLKVVGVIFPETVILCQKYNFNIKIYVKIVFLFEYIICLAPKLKVDSRIDTIVKILVGYPVIYAFQLGEKKVKSFLYAFSVVKSCLITLLQHFARQGGQFAFRFNFSTH